MYKFLWVMPHRQGDTWNNEYLPDTRYDWPPMLDQTKLHKARILDDIRLQSETCSSRCDFRVAVSAIVFFGCDVMVTLGVYFIFLVKFRKTTDIFGLSVEMKRVGAFYLVALSELFVLPASGSARG